MKYHAFLYSARAITRCSPNQTQSLSQAPSTPFSPSKNDCSSTPQSTQDDAKSQIEALFQDLTSLTLHQPVESNLLHLLQFSVL